MSTPKDRVRERVSGVFTALLKEKQEQLLNAQKRVAGLQAKLDAEQQGVAQLQEELNELNDSLVLVATNNSTVVGAEK